MRVHICIAAAALAVCIVATASAATDARPERASGTDPVTATWTEWPHQVSCLGGIPFDPVAGFSGPTGAENGSSSSARALRRILASGEIPRVRQHGWRLLGETDRAAEFAAGPLFDEPYPGSTSELAWIRLRRGGKQWELKASISGCTPQSVRHGVPAVRWSLVSGEHLNPDTRRVRIKLAPIECAGSRDAKPDVLAREVREQNGALLLTIWLRPARDGILMHGVPYCPGAQAPPLVIKLPEKLGDRELFDGGLYPPLPAVKPVY